MTEADDDSLERLSELASILRGADLRGISEEKLDELLWGILAHYLMRPAIYDHHQICYRARKCESTFSYNSLAECLNPPSGCPYYGRASVPHDPVVYSSWNVHTALDEIGAVNQDLVQITAFNVVPGSTIEMATVGDFLRRRNSGRSLFPDLPGNTNFQQWERADPKRFVRALYVDSLLAELFSWTSDRHFEYRISAMFAQTIYRSGLGLIYPSVRTPHAMNISHHRSLFDDRCQVLYTEVIKVEKFFGYSLYNWSRLKVSTAFSPEGIIDWNIANLPIGTIGQFGAPEPPENWIGWRPPKKPQH